VIGQVLLCLLHHPIHAKERGHLANCDILSLSYRTLPCMNICRKTMVNSDVEQQA